jgi:hypothetical protein
MRGTRKSKRGRNGRDRFSASDSGSLGKKQCRWGRPGIDWKDRPPALQLEPVVVFFFLLFLARTVFVEESVFNPSRAICNGIWNLYVPSLCLYHLPPPRRLSSNPFVNLPYRDPDLPPAPSVEVAHALKVAPGEDVANEGLVGGEGEVENAAMGGKGQVQEYVRGR